MAQLNAHGKGRVVAAVEPESPAEPDAPAGDLRATIALSPEALAALIDEVKRSQGDTETAPELDPPADLQEIREEGEEEPETDPPARR